MKKLNASFIALLPFLLSACVSNPNQGNQSSPVVMPQSVAECTFPDMPNVAAPNWVCSFPVAGVASSAVGSAEKTDAGTNFQKQMATANARVELAQTMKVEVANMIKQYTETTGAASQETVDKVNSSVSKFLTSETLIGSKVFRNRTSPNGVMYVLVGFDEANRQNVAKTALRSSMNNDSAAWQQFRAQRGQDELAAEIAKIRPR